MTIVGDVYACDVCGNTVKVIKSGEGTLVCCGQDMTPQYRNSDGRSKVWR